MGLQGDGFADYSTAASPENKRSQGVLARQDIQSLKLERAALAYDPLQNGWVRATCIDDFDQTMRRPAWPTPAPSPKADVTLRRWNGGDAALYRALLDNPAVWRHMPGKYPGPISEAMARDLIDLANDPELNTTRAIVFKGAVVGQVRLDHSGPDPELSYWLGQKHWERGIGSQAVEAFVRHMLEEMPDLRRMIARAYEGNRGSIRILERTGFSQFAADPARPGWRLFERLQD